VEEIRRTILQPAVDGLWEAGTPYVGVLYAGLMLTAEGPKVLEFNCRFGDPEAQAILPLLETDLAEVLWACVEGRLHEVRL
jgi:phosphoribosylamine--glycine ligase